MKRSMTQSIAIAVAALLLGWAIGCNFGSAPENAARAEGAPPGPADIALKLHDRVERISGMIDELRQLPETSGMNTRLLTQAACDSVDMDRDTYLFIKGWYAVADEGDSQDAPETVIGDPAESR